VIELEKVSAPELSIVFEPAVVGLELVPQQTPRMVTADPPSLVTFPPQVAVVEVRMVTVPVVMAGRTAEVFNVNTLP